MTDKIVLARTIRVGAERLRQIAASEAEAKRAAEMLRLAVEMDEHAAELERAVADATLEPTGNAAA